jgi:hypothetical protein
MIHYKIQEELDKNECLPKSLIEDKLAKARELLQRDAKPETDK